MNKKTSGASSVAAMHGMVQTKSNLQAEQNEQEFASLAMHFFGSFPVQEAVEFVQLATTQELADFLENYEEHDPEFVPDEIMEINHRGHQLVLFLSRTHELLNKIVKQTTNGTNPLPAGPAARA